MLHSKSVTNRVIEEENIRELAKYISAYAKDEKVDYMSLALLSKEGEVIEIDQNIKKIKRIKRELHETNHQK